MNENLDNLLCSKYPKIFKDRHASMQESCMYWGLEVGDGWYNILDRLCGIIQWRIDTVAVQYKSATKYNDMRKAALRDDNWEPFKEYYNSTLIKTEDNLEQYKKDLLKSKPRLIPKLVPQVVADQVKEKFGTLRFYYSGGDDVIDGMVQMAEAMSSVTCEECGAPGKTNDKGWLSTRCEAHTK